MLFNNTTYHFYTEVTFPNGIRSRYDAMFDIEMSKAGADTVHININRCYNEKTDDVAPKDFDMVMAWQGRALYPLQISVDERGNILRISNFEQVALRYQEEGNKIMEYYGHAPVVNDYIKASRENISSEKILRQCMAHTKCFQLIQMAYLQTLERPFVLKDFPFMGESSVLTFQEQYINEKNEILATVYNESNDARIVSKNGQLCIKRNERNITENILLQCCIEVINEGYYMHKAALERIKQ